MRDSFIFFCGEHLEDAIGVEVGVYKGENARDMLKYKNNLKLCLVDDFARLSDSDAPGYRLLNNEERDLLMRDMINNIAPVKERAVIYFKSSMDALKDFPDECFDYVYIDADHSARTVREDCLGWYPKVKKGGILAGHDYMKESVRDSVHSFIRENNIGEDKLQLSLQNGQSDWWFIK